jgi:hypothetical protein
VKIPEVQMPKGVEGNHKIRANYQPRDLEKSHREPVRFGRLVGRQRVNCVPNFLFHESGSESIWVELRQAEYVEVDGIAPLGGNAKCFIKEVEGNCHHGVFVGCQLVLMLQRVDMILTPPRVGVGVEEAGWRISFC